MHATISVTNKWQIHIPKSFRDAFGLEKPGKVAITAEKGKIIVTPVKSVIMRYAGKLHEKYNNKRVNVDKIRDLIDYSDL